MVDTKQNIFWNLGIQIVGKCIFLGFFLEFYSFMGHETQQGSQSVTLIPLRGFLVQKPRKVLLFGSSIARKGLTWRPNS